MEERIDRSSKRSKRDAENPKSQAPNSKKIPNSKFQRIEPTELYYWNLGFGVWDLGFHLSLPSNCSSTCSISGCNFNKSFASGAPIPKRAASVTKKNLRTSSVDAEIGRAHV